LDWAVEISKVIKKMYRKRENYYKDIWYQVCRLVNDIFLDKGLHNPASTSRDVHSQKVQTKSGTETQQTKVKTRSID
jgi:lipocalin